MISVLALDPAEYGQADFSCQQRAAADAGQSCCIQYVCAFTFNMKPVRHNLELFLESAAILSIDRALTIIGVQEQILKEFTDVLSKSAVQYTTTEQKAAAIADMLCTKLAENEWNTLKLVRLCVNIFSDI